MGTQYKEKKRKVKQKKKITYQLLDEIEQNTIQLKNEIYKLERQIGGKKKMERNE